MWRPKEGWKQPDTYCHLANVECIPKLTVFEAGADAMLDALKAEGLKIEHSSEWYNQSYANVAILALDKAGVTKMKEPIKGWLVFIPEKSK